MHSKYHIFTPKYRQRGPEGRILHGERICRYWKDKETGVKVEVRRLLFVDGTHFQVIYFEPIFKTEFTMPRPQFEKEFEPCGNRSAQF